MLYRGDDRIQDRSTKNRPGFGLSSNFGEPQDLFRHPGKETVAHEPLLLLDSSPRKHVERSPMHLFHATHPCKT